MQGYTFSPNLEIKIEVLRLQKQQFADVRQDRCSSNFFNIHRKRPVFESLFNNIAGLLINLQSNTGVIYCEIFKKNVFYKTPPVAAFVSDIILH